MIEKVREYLKNYGLEDKILEFSVSSATVELAAKALNIEEGRIAKSMAFDLNGKYILVVMAGYVKTDNAKFKSVFGQKAKMVQYDLVGDIIGHKAGGVCPFAINENIEVYLDNSLKKYQTVYPACGSSNSAIELSIDELEKTAQNFKGWVDVSKVIE